MGLEHVFINLNRTKYGRNKSWHAGVVHDTWFKHGNDRTCHTWKLCSNCCNQLNKGGEQNRNCRGCRNDRAEGHLTLEVVLDKGMPCQACQDKEGNPKRKSD